MWLLDDLPVIYFVTICEIQRRRRWAEDEFFGSFSAAVKNLENRNLWFVRSAIVMPDHLHLLVSPMKSRDQKIGDLSGALKRWTRQGIQDPNWDWQPGCFDRLLRREDSAEEKWEYMRENPVRAGLVGHHQYWRYSLAIREPRSASL